LVTQVDHVAEFDLLLWLTRNFEDDDPRRVRIKSSQFNGAADRDFGMRRFNRHTLNIQLPQDHDAIVVMMLMAFVLMAGIPATMLRRVPAGVFVLLGLLMVMIVH